MFFVGCSRLFFTKKWFFFAIFFKKSSFWVKFDIKNGFSDSLPFQKMYMFTFICITVTVEKLLQLSIFQNFLIDTSLNYTSPVMKLYFIQYFYHYFSPPMCKPNCYHYRPTSYNLVSTWKHNLSLVAYIVEFWFCLQSRKSQMPDKCWLTFCQYTFVCKQSLWLEL